MSDYVNEVSADIQEVLKERECLPVLFVGSGLSRRMFNAPSWKGLLDQVQKECPQISYPVSYHLQAGRDLIGVADVYAEEVMQWAWDERPAIFPEELYSSSNQNCFLKYLVSAIIKSATPARLNSVRGDTLRGEVKALSDINPHSVITTNYDEFLELVFPRHEPVIGQKVLKQPYAGIGEIFKIHGCVTNADGLVLTGSDYEVFRSRKKYLSAKLLALFAEHPVLFVGYSATDPNIQTILSDVDEIMADEGGVADNIFFLQRGGEIGARYRGRAREKVISLGDGRQMQVRSIVTDSFEWVFKAFAQLQSLEKIRPDLLRAVMARTHRLVRTDIPRKALNVDFKVLEQNLANDSKLPALFGVATIDEPGAVNAMFRFTLSDVGRRLGYNGWHGAAKLLASIAERTGIDLKSSDNRYHTFIPTGKTGSGVHKYTDAAVELLREEKAGRKPEISL